ncbi:Beta-glucan synthesis-associated protein SKN1 [Tetrabaena socialis]|uniref:Beta-glucan synthesis-associated protein SKN1 n=1 Tax=Tetrabaena socialis TaxID=47790 RepID=A0A2J7ZPT7_9CHLO|nr:Beta-glucan synthesis-associated protein SKN1 [Tetrabaena socialis]|eukprot:PNH02276.1 Beta-glucan synthesis-associated protein SKN1 [Tetrabaena socialis]
MEDMVLVFSDEFNSRWRDFSPGKDAKWQALDLLYVNGDEAVFRREAVTISGGAAVITASKTTNKGPFSAPWGDQLAEKPYTSGMLQGWNKFCFTGGYMEARIKLPGDDIHGGFWPAVFTLGNLGRAGYLRSTDGTWPWSYDTCDANALRQQPWSDHNGQRYNACNSTKGRGASEIDLLEVGVWQSSQPQLSTSMHLAPVLPLGLHWLDNVGGVYFPTYADPTLYRIVQIQG